jgi:hypothetical protein
MRWTRKLALASAIGLGLGIGGTLVIRGRDRLPELTPERLAESRGRFAASGIASYDLDLVTRATGLDAGAIHVEVRGGRVARAERDSIPMTGDVESYTVPGLFRSFEQELALARSPERLGAPPGYRVYLQARFDPELGHPLRFRRIVGGANRVAELEVTGFARR